MTVGAPDCITAGVSEAGRRTVEVRPTGMCAGVSSSVLLFFWSSSVTGLLRSLRFAPVRLFFASRFGRRGSSSVSLSVHSESMTSASAIRISSAGRSRVRSGLLAETFMEI